MKDETDRVCPIASVQKREEMGDIRPTAKWANRILRPLTSIHHRLKKHQDNLAILASVNVKTAKERHEGWPSTHHRPRSSSAAPAAATRDTGTASVREYGSDSNSEPDDPVWVPGKPVKRRIRHSYSSRGQRSRGGRRRSRLTIRSPEVQRTLPGAIEIVTPLITGEKKTTGLVEGTVLPRRLFDDATTAAAASAMAGNGRKKTRASYGGMSATSTTSNSFYAVYNTPWKEALDRCGDPGLADIVRVLDRLLIKFLLSTRVHQQQQPEHSGGARSLFSTAVRRLPEFIAEEQILQSAEKGRSDEDMCDAYFTELEACYAPSGNGWTPLREAVRAQGINLVSAMLQKPCFTGLMTCRLLDVCVERHEYDAVESLLSGLLSTMGETYDSPTAFDSGGLPGDDPVQFLYGYWLRAPSHRTFVFHEIAKLLLRGSLPAEWMVTTRWKKIVDAAIQSLSTGENDSAAAAHLLEAVILSASGVFPSRRMIEDIVARGGRFDLMHLGPSGPDMPWRSIVNIRRKQPSPCTIPIQDALGNLALSLITALCGMHLARSFAVDTAEAIEQQQGGVGMRVRTIMGSTAFHVQREIEMYYLSETMAELLSSPSYALRRGSILLGECLLQCNDGHYQQQQQQLSTPTPCNNLHTFYQTVSSRSGIIKELADLARQVFSCTQRMRRTDAATVDQPGTPVDVRDRVVQLAEMSDQRSLATFLGRVAAETAMQMAESTADPDDHVWAVEVQERAVARQAHLQKLSGDIGTSSDSDDYGDGDRSDNDSGDGPGLYRWEESIEEWVAATPVAKMRAKRLVVERSVGGHASSSRDSNSGSSSRASTPEHTASSVTSSAPSCVPLKRPYPEPTRPAKKRRRPASWGGVMQRSRAVSVSSSSASASAASTAASDDHGDVDDHNDWQDNLRSEFRRRNELMVSLREPMPMPMIIQGPDFDQPTTHAHHLRPSVGFNQSPPCHRSSHETCSPARADMGAPPPPEPESDGDGGTDTDTDEDDLCQLNRSGPSGNASPALFCGSTTPAKRIIPRRSISKPIAKFSVAEDEDSDDELSFL